MLDELEAQAHEMYDAGEYSHALADFSVLREVRARREGPYSVKYLRALHDCVRCMRHLQLWQDSDAACRELYGKYVRTHGRGGAVTVDVAKHWAWAMLQLNAIGPAVALYVRTADALWERNAVSARRLLGAAAVYARRVADGASNDPRAADRPTGDPLAELSLTHTTELSDAFAELRTRLSNDSGAAPSIDFDGATPE